MPPEQLRSIDDDGAALAAKLAQIEEAALRGASQSDLQILMNEVHGGFKVTANVYEPGITIYRAVRVAAHPRTLSRLGRPPEHLVRDAGRANLSGESVFYGSFDSATACLFECHCAPGELFAVSRWETTEKMMLMPYGYLNEDVQKMRRESGVFGAFMSPGTSREQDAIIATWQSVIFTAPASAAAYALSIALFKLGTRPIGNPELALAPAFAGILYPSVALELAGDNVALTADFADRALKFIDCELVHVDWVKPKNEFVLNTQVVKVRHVDMCTKSLNNHRFAWNREPTAMSYR